MVIVVLVADMKRGAGGMVGTPIWVQNSSLAAGPLLVRVRALIVTWYWAAVIRPKNVAIVGAEARMVC